ncbi:Uncharacterised protein [Neisseria zoodegmatis]|uniref:Uncharacterized protein n=1 Tax=Neisseria zoodegmatis TaxID=326523 RepID=A0A378WSF9_9NEIS|nr:Uncharacterised protein [Neisseria zoodegmatis]
MFSDGLFSLAETFAKPHANKQPEHSSSCSGCFCVKSRQATPKVPLKCLIMRHCLPVQAATGTPILLAAFNRFTHIAFRWLCALTLPNPK